MSKYWIVVAAAEHVRRGRAGGFTQACHGKAAPLKRMKPGDGVVCYSPTASFRGKDRLQAFTAIGVVDEGEPYLAEMGERRPYRRDVAWADAEAAPIGPLLEALDLTAGRANWGYQFRFGALAISGHDFGVIAEAMGAPALLAA
ncbi:MAG TPA: EVE domain-containing protein [Roseiarcus sp.]|nr:EVE domain-containing protein [Roseiarcus sp.]